MNHVLNELIQLQELHLALDEGKVADTAISLEPLEIAVAKILDKLPEHVATRYRQIHGRYPLAVVPLMRNTCSQCGLVLPPNLVNATRAATEIQTCPHCGRFLYSPAVIARRPVKPANSHRRIPAGIARFSAEELMVPKLAASTREEAITELSELLAKQGFIENAATVTQLALEREAIISTAYEHGLAFPHVRNVEGGSLAFALGLKAAGIKFDEAEQHRTKIIFFIVIPTVASAFYLRLLAGLVESFSEKENRDALQSCETPEAMWETLIKLTQQAIP